MQEELRMKRIATWKNRGIAIRLHQVRATRTTTRSEASLLAAQRQQ
jgi:hypothetical protein